MNKLVQSLRVSDLWVEGLPSLSCQRAQENITYSLAYILANVPFCLCYVQECKNFGCVLLFPLGCGSRQVFWGDIANLRRRSSHSLSCTTHPLLFQNLTQNILEWWVLNSGVSRTQRSEQGNQQANQLSWGREELQQNSFVYLRDGNSSGLFFTSSASLYWVCTFTVSGVMYQLNLTLHGIWKEKLLFSNNTSRTMK